MNSLFHSLNIEANFLFLNNNSNNIFVMGNTNELAIAQNRLPKFIVLKLIFKLRFFQQQ